ncbi:uncharacterized protein LOC131941455 [Physella acuta]|uniref:uncharacterized protein LOC131941455 n=1 Tax=Physella acuta TaxID=109671 RepID=UPI0027DB50B4|nr:uncharacterized protein LOC131941455 [Physella acuta]XP_059156705.1 uncharacterized protein LOC131941455 [Physella acuta]XP_059156706.1 uncharacterized protein LOC131941455 [Physella acuta]
MASGEDLSEYFTGTHEVEECLDCEGEADPPLSSKVCKKSHEGFIVADKFTIEHLPVGYQDNDLYDLVNAMAGLTVQIKVKYTSADRPELIPGTEDLYPCSKYKGEKRVMFYVTGRVWMVRKYMEGMDGYRTSPCASVGHTCTAGQDLWLVDVMTSRHVVFDAIEARNSTCRLWYDNGQSPKVNIDGWKVGVSNTDQDICVLHCVTHDPDVAQKLSKTRQLFVR